MEADIFRFDFDSSNGREGHLDEEESTHILKVLRMKLGEPMVLANGKGLKAKATLIGVKGKFASVQFDEPELFSKRKQQLSLAIALPKSTDRVDWLISKATEIGVEAIIPIITQRSERQKLNLERLNRIAWSAIKQSRQWYLPSISEPITIQSYFKEKNLGYICHQHTPETPSFLEAINGNTADSFDVLVGPEGDFTKEELDLALSLGWQTVTLGRNRLRTETAGIFVCSLINAINK